MIYILLILGIYIWPFGQLLNFSLPQFSFTLYPLDLLAILLLLSLVISHQRRQIFRTPLTIPLLVFLSVALISFLVNLRQGINMGLLASSLYLLRLFIYPSFYFAIRHIGFSKVRKPIILSLIIFSVIGLVQYLFFPDMRFLKNLGFDDHYYRLIGSLYDPNFSGAIFCAISLFLLSSKKYLKSLPFVFLLALTFSRASYLAFLCGLLLIIITQKKIKILVLALLLGLVIYFIPKPFGEGVNLSRTFSIFSRIESWQQGISLFSQKPILGWGYNNLRSPDGSRFQIDNSFIFLLATTGIFGLLSYLALINKIYSQISTSTKVLVLSIFVHSLFNNTLFYIWISAFFWLSLGIDQKTKA